MSAANGAAAPRPRIAYGGGTLPLHVQNITGSLGGSYTIEFMETRSLRSRFGFPGSLHCADEAALALRLTQLVAARIPFMVGHMTQGPSDEVFARQRAQGKPVNYLEIALGGRTGWWVREITDATEGWRGDALGQWQKSRLRDLQLGQQAALDEIFATRLPPSPCGDRPLQTSPALAESTAAKSAHQSLEASAPEAPVVIDMAPEPATVIEPKPAELGDQAGDPAPEAARITPSERQPARRMPGLGCRQFRWLGSDKVVERIAHTLIFLGLGWAIRILFALLHMNLLDDQWSDVAVAAGQSALGAAIAYAAFWITLFPRAFAGWYKRLLLFVSAVVIGFPIAVCGLLAVNVDLDSANSEIIRSQVLEKRIGKIKNRNPDSWTYGLIVRAWRPDRDEERIIVTRAHFETVFVGDSIEFRLHPGHLAWAWYETTEIRTIASR